MHIFISFLLLKLHTHAHTHTTPPTQWQWDKIKSNTHFILQFGSSDDPFIPWHEHKAVHNGLKSELFAFDNEGHFQETKFPRLKEALRLQLEKLAAVGDRSDVGDA